MRYNNGAVGQEVAVAREYAKGETVWKSCRLVFERWRGVLLVAAICLPAILPLLWRPSWEFGADWPTHVYPIGYQSHYLRQHHWFSETLNTDWVAGMPYPIFYAVIFYPLAAVLAVFVGADWAIRLIAIALIALQTWQVQKLIRAAGGKEGLSWLGASTLAWGTYALTNLYTRGAVAEFVAVSLLVSATASLLRSVLPWQERNGGSAAAKTDAGEGRVSRGRLAFQGAFLYALSAGSHPITALFGTIFLGCVLAPLFLGAWRKTLLPLLAGGLVALLMLSPWLYVMGKFRGKLTVERESMKQVVHFKNHIDSVQSRLWPWPRDIRVEQARSLEEVPAPYLDAQISVPLLLLAGFVSFRVWSSSRRGSVLHRSGIWLAGVSWAVFAVAFVLSVYAWPWTWLPRMFHGVQFAYRLVSYQNLALLTALIGALVAVSCGSVPKRAERARWAQPALWLGSLAGLGVMLSHAMALQQAPNPDLARCQRDPNYHIKIPDAFYGWPAYSVLGGNAETNKPAEEIYLPAGVRKRFGEVGPKRFELAAATNVCLQVQAFPWNKVYLNGELLDESRVRTRPQGYTIELPAGVYEVARAWEPDRAWVWLDLVSKFTVVVGGLMVIGLAVREKCVFV